MTAQTLINKIRPKVGDRNANKWTNKKIIEIINEGLDDLGRKGQVKYKTKSIPIVPYQRELVINDAAYVKLKRVRLNNKPLPAISKLDLDSKISKWEEDVGSELKYIVYGTQNIGILTLYPLLDETSADYKAINENTKLLIDIIGVEADDVYGLITSIDVDDIVTKENIYNPDITQYQPIMSLSTTFITLTIDYYCVPTQLDEDSDTLETDIVDLNETYIKTLIYYVAGILLFEDSRTENKTTGTGYLQIYNKEKQELIGRNAESQQDIQEDMIPYRTGFEE